PKRRAAVSAPRRPISRHRAGSARRSRRAALQRSGSPGTTRPAPLSATTGANPTSRVTTTGPPAAIPSRTTLAKFSEPAGGARAGEAARDVGGAGAGRGGRRLGLRPVGNPVERGERGAGPREVLSFELAQEVEPRRSGEVPALDEEDPEPLPQSAAAPEQLG